MLTAPAFPRRVAAQACVLAVGQRSYALGRRGTNGDEKGRLVSRSKADKKDEKRESNANDTTEDAKKPAAPSLIEQLFPERYAAGGTHRNVQRVVPTIFSEPLEPREPGESRFTTRDREEAKKRPTNAELARRAMEAQPPNTSVLVLKNAGKNLTEEDFRRVIPQGKHLEGWTLEQGDILRVIPGRDLETLDLTGDYYLLFSSPLSAFTYQGHVTRIHNMVRANAPSSLLSPIVPPPGYMLEGMDAHEAINSFTILPPDQSIHLRQLKPPLSPLVQALVKHGGYEPLMQRKDRMTYEARLLLEGPQLQLPAIRHILRASARDRGLSWSGDENETPKLSQWEPIASGDMLSPSNKKQSAFQWAKNQARDAYKEDFPSATTMASTEDVGADPSNGDGPKRRKARPVYIAGFANEQALHSFIHFWHERAMTWEGAGKAGGDEEGDMPPVTHVDVLW